MKLLKYLSLVFLTTLWTSSSVALSFAKPVILENAEIDDWIDDWVENTPIDYTASRCAGLITAALSVNDSHSFRRSVHEVNNRIWRQIADAAPRFPYRQTYIAKKALSVRGEYGVTLERISPEDFEDAYIKGLRDPKRAEETLKRIEVDTLVCEMTMWGLSKSKESLPLNDPLWD